MVTFPSGRDGFMPSLGEAELAVGTVGAMRRSHMDLEAKRHFIITDWAIHKLSLSSNTRLYKACDDRLTAPGSIAKRCDLLPNAEHTRELADCESV
jgi:hypothetical protein